MAIPISVLFKFYPEMMSLISDETYLPIPFLNRTLYVFLILVVLMVLISLKDKNVEIKSLEVEKEMFKVENTFAILSIIIFGILIALYTVFW